MPATRTNQIYWFKEVSKDDLSLVGTKGAHAGELIQAGFPIPPGFIVSTKAYYAFLKENNLTTKITHLINTINFNHPESLMEVSSHIRKLIFQGVISQELILELFRFYKTLGGVLEDPLVKVSTSIASENLPVASLTAKEEIYTHVKGEANVILKVKEAWASLFDPRALFYRHEHKFDHFQAGVAVIIERMIDSERSGIMFTVDPVLSDKSKVIIEAVFGLSEYLLRGKVTPDHYEVDKAEKNILRRALSSQDKKLERFKGKDTELPLSLQSRKKQKLSDQEIVGLADLGKRLEKHFYFPQDIEWAIDKEKIYVIQTRPITTMAIQKQEDTPSSRLPLLLSGSPASPGLASGPIKILHSIRDAGLVLPGDIIVISQTSAEFIPVMKKAAGIITEHGGRTSHAATASREVGKPAVVGIEKAFSTLKNGMVVTVNGSKGEVYKGATFTSISGENNSEKEYVRTATKVYVSLDDAQGATSMAAKNIDGVGLLRGEYLLEKIGIHPKKMIRDGKKHEFIEKLVSELETFCEAFNPRPIIYRASDFKTSDYRKLHGGKEYEPLEENPVLGYRGAFRYIHDSEVFEMELEAIKIVRQKKNLKNLWLMIPFVRTVKELVEVKKIINDAGLQRSPLFRLWMMLDTPANVILLDDFIKAGIDGVTIGSNELTMLLLGTDRENSEIVHSYDELNPAVLLAFEQAITIARRNQIPVGISGQAVSLYPDLIEKLVTWGITAITVSPQVIDSARKHIAIVERRMLRQYTFK